MITIMNDYVPKHRFEILKENQIEIQREVYRDTLIKLKQKCKEKLTKPHTHKLTQYIDKK